MGVIHHLHRLFTQVSREDMAAKITSKRIHQGHPCNLAMTADGAGINLLIVQIPGNS
jgi:hypothetical protein